MAAGYQILYLPNRTIDRADHAIPAANRSMQIDSERLSHAEQE
jgi:hypothetical protein